MDQGDGNPILLTSGDAEICAESFGDPAHPAILLLAGGGSSMDWWEDEFCELLARRGRLVIRFDYRDTGRSTTYGPGDAEYAEADFIADVIAVLDHFEVSRGHLVGLSMGGGIAQVVALRHRDRVATLTLMMTSPAVGGDDLAGMAPALEAAFAASPPEPDWSDREATIDYLVESERPFSGTASFDEARSRAIAARVYDRSEDLASAANHSSLGGDADDRTLGELEGIPTLVFEGDADPMFPGHGSAIAAAIPGARLIELQDVGHQYPPPRLWGEVVDALTEHTAS
jgi:pimeloyl-ACP methyl ester carboxylesterase